MFRRLPLSIIRILALYTQQYIQVMLTACNQHNIHDIHTPDDGHRYCPKHVESYSKNKFEKLVFLVGFIIRIYHDARSSECQKIK